MVAGVSASDSLTVKVLGVAAGASHGHLVGIEDCLESQSQSHKWFMLVMVSGLCW